MHYTFHEFLCIVYVELFKNKIVSIDQILSWNFYDVYAIIQKDNYENVSIPYMEH